MKRKHSLFLLVFLLLGGDTGTRERGSYVLLYHSFLGKSEYVTDVSKEDLKAQLLKLKKQGFRFVSFNDIIKNKISGTKNILITIDDGNRSIYPVYKKVLKPMGIKPLLGIYVHSIGRIPALLTWEMLKELADDGCEIASHGYYHFYLDEKLYKTNRRAFLKEIIASKEMLEMKLNKKITVFMYPYGVVYENARIELKRAGYRYAFNLKWGFVHIPIENNRDVFDLPRYMVMDNWDRIYLSIMWKERKREKINKDKLMKLPPLKQGKNLKNNSYP